MKNLLQFWAIYLHSKKTILYSLFLLVLFGLSVNSYAENSALIPGKEKQIIKALYIPLADHYAALVVYERYRNKMKFADFQIEQMKNWDFLILCPNFCKD